jgi:alpha-L-rhamnosidase
VIRRIDLKRFELSDTLTVHIKPKRFSFRSPSNCDRRAHAERPRMSVTVDAPRIEHHREALGIGERMPRLSWRVSSAPPGWRQTAYSVEVERGGDVTTYVVDSPDQVLVDWPAEPLHSREIVTVRIAVRGADGAWSTASGPTVVEAGLLEPGDWVARPVGSFRNENPHSDERRPSLVRRAFEVRDDIVRARLYATAHGVYEAELNGERVGDDTLSPGWTVYGRRLRYYTYDVTGLVRPGHNALGAWLGDGWYRGRLGWRGGFRNVYGSGQSFPGQLELTYADGTRDVVATRESSNSR